MVTETSNDRRNARRLFLRAHKAEMIRDFEEHSKLIEALDKRGLQIASGGWCRCCAQYACGEGGVNHT